VFKYNSSWSDQPTSPEIFSARSGHCGFSLNDTLFIFGGQLEPTGEVFNSSYKLDLLAQEWSILPCLPQPCHSATCCLFRNFAYIFGGANQEGVLDSLLIFDPGNS